MATPATSYDSGSVVSSSLMLIKSLPSGSRWGSVADRGEQWPRPLDPHLQETWSAAGIRRRRLPGREGVPFPGPTCEDLRIMRYRVLGPLEVSGTDGRPVDVGGAKPRALLTLLLADANRVVGIDRIVATLWGDTPRSPPPLGGHPPPPTVTGTLQAYVSHLRRVLEPERGPREAPTVLLTRPPGYLLRVDAADLDALRFPELVDEGERAIQGGDPGRGVRLLDQALKLWRGEPLAELGDTPSAATDRLRLVELHVRA